MIIKKINANYSCKHSTSNFGTIQYSAGIELELDEKDDYKEKYRWAFQETRSQVLQQMNNSLEARKQSTQDLKQEMDLPF